MRTVGRIIVILGVGAVYAALTGLLLFAGQACQPSQLSLEDIRPSDGVVVLTGGENRIREGLRLMTAAPVRRVLISGVYRTTSRDEFRRRFLLPATLADCCLDIGYVAQDTIGNAEETREWAHAWGFRRLIVVTSGYHMPRSLLELRRVLPGVELVPYKVRWGDETGKPWWLNSQTARLVVREYGKFLWAYVRA